NPVPRRLADGEDGHAEEKAGDAEDEEDQLPGPNLAHERQFDVALVGGELDDGPAEQEGQPGAEVDAHRINADGRGSLFAREAIGEERIGGGGQGGLADADTESAQEELPVVLGQAAGSGHQAPEAEADHNDPAPTAGVSEPAQGDAADGVEDGEAEPH